MDSELVLRLIDRDWGGFVSACERLGLGVPNRDLTRIDLVTTAPGTKERFRSVLLCDDYDAQAPILDFADVETGSMRGREQWPQMADAPLNSVSVDGTYLPILCWPGTRGYHIHQSHTGETYPRSVWCLTAVATVLWRLFNKCGSLQGRGV